MLTTKTITHHSRDYKEFARLYHESFPKNEQVPLCDLLNYPNDTEMKAYYEDGEFSGFYAAIKENNILCILYFSVEENKRDHGIGSQILNDINKLIQIIELFLMLNYLIKMQQTKINDYLEFIFTTKMVLKILI